MQNAHLRLGLLEYQRITEKVSTRIRVRVDRYVGEGRKAHLLSVFGNDSDVGAITAAIHDKGIFTLYFPDGAIRDISLGDHACCYKGAVTLADRKHPVRHLLAVSEELRTNGSIGQTVLLRYQRDEAWATLVSFLGLPGCPAWSSPMLATLERDGRVKSLDGIGCKPVLIATTSEDILKRIEDGVRAQVLELPKRNGPICWPIHSLEQVLRTAHT